MWKASGFVLLGLIFVAWIGSTAWTLGEERARSTPTQRPVAQAPGTKSAAPRPAPATAEKPETANQHVLPGRWVSRCVSEGRSSTLDCVVEQSAVVTQTGQLLVQVT